MRISSVTFLKILFTVVFGAITFLVIKTSLESDMFVTGGRMWRQEPWFRATIYDFYFNILIISTWAYYKEKSKGIAALWILGFVLLGSIATSFYILRQLFALKPTESFSKVLLKNE